MNSSYPTYKLGEICDILNGFAFKSSNYVSDGLRVIRITNVKKGFVIDEEPQFYPIETQEELKKYVLKKGDLLISLTGNVGRVGILNEELLPAALNQRVGCLRVKDKSLVSLQYLFHLFNTDSFEKDCIDSSKGIAQKNMSTEWLKEYEVTLPPLATQRAIVTRIESLFAELDKGVEKLKTAQLQLKVYRQAVLNDCLTKQEWPIVNIIDIIEKGKNALKAGPFGSALKKDCYVEKGYKIYGQEQVINGNPFIGNYYVDETKYKELESCKIQEGDILISLVGTVGKVLILPKGVKEGIINPRLIKITLNQQIYDAKFFKYYFESSKVKSFYKINASGTTMDVLNIGIIKQIPFPLPSLPEQQRIVQEIETRLSQAELVEASIEQSLQQAEALRQSILKKAFSGELV